MHFSFFPTQLYKITIELYRFIEHTRSNKVRHSIVASIPACHAGDRGSIPRDGILFLFTCTHCSIRRLVGPGFALGIRASESNESNRSSMRALILFSLFISCERSNGLVLHELGMHTWYIRALVDGHCMHVDMRCFSRRWIFYFYFTWRQGKVWRNRNIVVCPKSFTRQRWDWCTRVRT